MTNTLYDYYSGKGEALPSVEERAKTAATYGISNYSGTADQNTQLLGNLQSGTKASAPTVAPTEPTSEKTIAEILGGYSSGGTNPYNGDAMYANIAKNGSPLTTNEEGSIRDQVIGRYQGEINSAKDAYASLLKSTQLEGTGRLGETTAMNARAGLLGGDFGAAQTDKTRSYNRSQEQQVLESQANALASIMSRANTEATSEISARRAAKTAGYGAYQSYLEDSDARKKTSVSKIARSFINSNIDPSSVKNELAKITAQLKKSGVNVSTQDIIDSYLEEKSADEQAILDANKPFDLSEGQVKYAFNPDTGAYEKIAFNPKTYKPESEGAGGMGGSGTISPEAQNIIKQINLGANINDLIKGSSVAAQKLRNEVYAGLNDQGGYSDTKKTELNQNIKVIDDLLKSDYGSVFGIKGFNNLIPGTNNQIALNLYNQLQGILSLENRQKLKGSGAISDFEFRVLSDAASSLGSNVSDADAVKVLGEIRTAFKSALDRGDALKGSGSESTITNDDDLLKEFDL